MLPPSSLIMYVVLTLETLVKVHQSTQYHDLEGSPFVYFILFIKIYIIECNMKGWESVRVTVWLLDTIRLSVVSNVSSRHRVHHP
jgi:hypothetical protein